MIGVIADDLSGAAELGAVGLRHGLRAVVVMDGRVSGEADLICVDTDSRGCDAKEAAARARAAASALATAGARWIYKKVDSVLRGQVSAEVRGVMEELNLSRALLVPANPSLGRVIRDGKYFVGGTLLHETEFARDPQYPRKSSLVAELLRMPGLAETRVSALGGELPASGVVVGEAQSAEDLRGWAGRVDAGILPAGAAEFFGALLAASWRSAAVAKESNEETSSDEERTGAELFVCGSMSESSRKFVEASRGKGVAVFSLAEELAAGVEFGAAAMEGIARQAAAALQERRRVILNIGLPLVREPGVASLLASHLVKLAGRVLERAEVARVYAEGGETAAALARRMRWGRLAVMRELAPGVVTVAVAGNARLRFTLKPGTYAWPPAIMKL